MNSIGNHSEYGTLREVVVGDAQGLALPPMGPSLAHYNPELRAALVANGDLPLAVQENFPDRWRRTCEQMDAIARLFADNGVVVHRPRGFTAAERGYLAAAQPGCSQLYPADPVFVLGKHFIELNIRRAYRRKEVFPLREIVLPMVAGDAAAHHVAMPPAAPHLSTDGAGLSTDATAPSADGGGPFLEGGDILLLGRDVLVGIGELCTDQAGFDWLTRYLAPHGYRTHAVRIRGPILHALGVMCLLREGLGMAYLPALADGLPPPLADWEMIELTEQEMMAHASVGVSLDARRYVVDGRHRRVMDELVKRGIEPVAVECDAIGHWGGAIRCITLPLRRD